MKVKLFGLAALGVVALSSSLDRYVRECGTFPDRLIVDNQLQLVDDKTKKYQQDHPLGLLWVIGAVSIGLALVLPRQNSIEVQKQYNVASPPIGKLTSLKKKLTCLVGGDSTTAQRLVKNIRFKYPEKDELWCWEKAIFDLERDRLYL